MPPWIVSQGGYACGCVARVSAHECSALSVCVCAVVHVVTHSFSARGVKARPSPLAEASRKLHPNPKGRHDPTAGGPHMHPHTTCLSSTDIPGVEVC